MRFQIRTRIGVLAAVALAATAAAPSADAQTLPPAIQIVERYVEAVGGRDAFRQHDSRRSEVEMAMPAAGMTMTMEVLQARPNFTLTSMTLPGMGTMTSGYDGQVAWAMDPMSGARILSGDELEQTRQQSHFDSNLDFARLFPTMETVERATMGDRTCYNVRMVTEGGVEVHNCFDTETGLLIGAVTEQTSPMGTMTAEMLFEDYQRVDGILMPMRTRMQMMGQEMVLTVKSVSHDPIDPSVFALPAQVRALVQ
jgi:hypothetical protein